MSRAQRQQQLPDPSMGYTNAFTNLLEPFRGTTQLIGTAAYVTNETLVGMIVKRFMGMPRDIKEQLKVHLLTVPLRGAVRVGTEEAAPPAAKSKTT